MILADLRVYAGLRWLLKMLGDFRIILGHRNHRQNGNFRHSLLKLVSKDASHSFSQHLTSILIFAKQFPYFFVQFFIFNVELLIYRRKCTILLVLSPFQDIGVT